MPRRVTRSASRGAARPSPASVATPPQPSPSPAPSSTDLPTMSFPDATAFETWLTENTSSSPGIWLQISKKSAPVDQTVNYDQALDVALCLGWIDGQRRSLDDNYFLQRFTPRRKASLWSRRNVDKVAVLTAAGRMRPEGQAAIDAAKEDGRWERAYAGSSTIDVPADFDAALRKNKKAKTFFDALSKAQRYPFLWRIETAKKPETRRRRIEQFVELLAQSKTL